MLRGYAGDDHADNEQQYPSQQRMHQREDRAARDQRDEEQPSLRAQNGQWAVHRFMHFVLSWTACCHLPSSFPLILR